MHRVEVAAYDLEGPAGGEKSLQAFLHRLGRHQRVGILVRLGRKMNAPALRRTLPVEQVRPFLRIGNVVAIGIAVPAEIIGHFDIQRAVGIGEAFEFDATFLAHDAARAFGTDDVATLQGFAFARLVLDKGRHAVGVL